VAVRRAATTAEILAAAWRLADRDGLGGFSLRDVAAEVSMQPPSLYSYVRSKDDLYDLMFRQVHDDLLPLLDDLPDDPEEAFREGNRRVFDHCVEQPARFTLVFLRTLPGFAPSAASYARAQELYSRLQQGLAGLGVTDPRRVDLWTALMTGLMSQQVANDPGGQRWRDLLDDATTDFLATTPRRTR
jgi:AcrR family transcriptional regulator